MVARLHGVQEVPGSNPGVPTHRKPADSHESAGFFLYCKVRPGPGGPVRRGGKLTGLAIHLSLSSSRLQIVEGPLTKPPQHSIVPSSGITQAVSGKTARER